MEIKLVMETKIETVQANALLDWTEKKLKEN